jgi:hypothetical protein
MLLWVSLIVTFILLLIAAFLFVLYWKVQNTVPQTVDPDFKNILATDDIPPICKLSGTKIAHLIRSKQVLNAVKFLRQLDFFGYCSNLLYQTNRKSKPHSECYCTNSIPRSAARSKVSSTIVGSKYLGRPMQG